MNARVIQLTAPEPEPEEENEEYYLRNDAGRARRFVDRYRDEIRYVPKFHCWLLWDEHRWIRDEDGGITRLALEQARDSVNAANSIKNAASRALALRAAVILGENQVIARMLALAKVDKRIVASHHDLDADPNLLGVQNGVIDLKTGGFRAGRKEDMITKSAGCRFIAGTKCPQWLAFLEKVLARDADLVTYLQKFVGYALTGDVSEQCFLFLFGSGKNGKSVFAEILHALMGEYGQRAPSALLTACVHGREPHNEIARLHGARLVIGSETEEGARLAESRVKDLTGGDTLTGRRLYEEAFEFKPVLKLLIFGNHKPAIRGTDEGIWRRVRLVPFTVQIPEAERDRQLPAKLAAELSGILNWAIAGCLAWRAEGLKAPARIVQASEDYQTEEDTLGDFIESELEFEEGQKVSVSELFEKYTDWAKRTGQAYPMNQQKLSRRLNERPQFERVKSNGQAFWNGVSLK